MWARRLFSGLLPGVLLRVLPATALVLLVIGFVASVFIEDAVLTQLKSKHEREAAVGAENIASKLDTLRLSVRAVATNDLVINGLVDVEARDAYVPIFFDGLQIAGPRGGALISFTDYRGRLIASNWKGADYTKAPWLSRVMNGREHLSITDGMTLVVPVIHQGVAEGAIVVEYRREHVAQLMSFAPSDGAALVTRNGKIVHASNGVFSDAFKSGGASAPDWLGSTAKVPRYPEFAVVVGKPSDLVLAPIVKLERFMYTALALALLALAASTVSTGLLTTRPLNRLIESIKGFGSAEDLDRRIDVDGAREFQDLAQSFNAMLERLKQAVVSNDSLARENAIRQQAERSLKESERRYRDLIEGAARAIYIYRDDRLQFANPSLARMFGYASPRELLAEGSLTQLLGEDIGAQLGRQLKGSGGPGGPTIRTELMLESGRDEPLWVEHVSKVIEWEGGLAIEGNLADITDRKRVERLKNDFISVVSHELRTPLTALVGSLGLIRSGTLGEIPGKAGELVEIAHGSAGRLVALVNDMLDIQKMESGNMEFDLSPTECVALTRRAIAETEAYGTKYGVRFRLEERLGTAHVRADGARLIQVLANLLSNAAKFSPKGKEVVVRLTREDERIHFAVIDRGAGIPPEMHEKIFEKFTQVDTSNKRSKDGTGLGLSICKAIVEEHGGSMHLSSEPGMGAIFTFALPEVRVVLDMDDIVAVQPAIGRR